MLTAFRRAAALAVIAFAALFAHPGIANAQVRIMPLGDSITAGPGCWRAYLWNRLQTAGFTNIDFVGSQSDGGGCNPGFPYDFDHEGHSGFSITGIARDGNLPPWLAAARPDIVVVHLGTNDMWGGFIPLQDKLTAYTTLIGQMRANNPNMKIIVAQIIPMDAAGCTTCMADVVAFNNALPAWAAGLTTAQSPITLVDQWIGFDVVADTGDRVHPVTSGFIKMGDKFFPAVAAALGGTSNLVALSVTRAGAGSGTVTSSPAGINCGAACSASFTSGSSVTLTAAAATGSTFAGWSGACTGTASCTLSMTQARSVTATFNASSTFPLAVTRAGTGTGTVTSSPAGISCGGACTANYSSGTSVTLGAAPAGGSTFGGWSGACSGTGTCTVSMTAARNVTATFNSSAQPATLTVTRAGSGTGTVTSNPTGINCGSTCTANFASGTSVTLTAAATSGSAFAGWSGACTGTAGCTVSMTQARSVTATFNTSGGGTGGTCANPITFSGNTGNFNTTGAACYRTNATVNGWGCYNFDGRTVTVGGVARSCGQMPLTRAADGYYYFAATAGQFPWAGLFTW